MNLELCWKFGCCCIRSENLFCSVIILGIWWFVPVLLFFEDEKKLSRNESCLWSWVFSPSNKKFDESPRLFLQLYINWYKSGWSSRRKSAVAVSQSLSLSLPIQSHNEVDNSSSGLWWAYSGIISMANLAIWDEFARRRGPARPHLLLHLHLSCTSWEQVARRDEILMMVYNELHLLMHHY